MTKPLALLVILLAAAPARADEPAPTTYLGVDAVVLQTQANLGRGFAVDGGYALEHGLWLHGRIVIASPDSAFDPGSNGMLQLRAGIEHRACVLGGGLCSLAGLDVGLAHDDDTTAEGADGNPETVEAASRAIGVARLGVDLGGTNVRVRATFELGASPDGLDNASAALGLAYRW